MRESPGLRGHLCLQKGKSVGSLTEALFGLAKRGVYHDATSVKLSSVGPWHEVPFSSTKLSKVVETSGLIRLHRRQ